MQQNNAFTLNSHAGLPWIPIPKFQGHSQQLLTGLPVLQDLN